MAFNSVVYNEDCIKGMQRYEDKFFDLAIVDPPYGIGMDGQKLCNKNKNKKHNRKKHDFKSWDNKIPNKIYFDELFRVSKNQIIWGGNYFTDYLKPTKAWVFWYKGQNDLTMSDGEMAWTSFKNVTRQFTLNRAHLIAEKTFHPTTKPIKLYKWLLDKYAKQGDKILDTHLGSGSSRIAAYDYGFDFTAFEIDEDYYQSQENRFNNHISQLNIFSEI